MQHMRVLEVIAAVGLTALGSLGIVAMAWHRSAEAGVLTPVASPGTPTPLTRIRGIVEAVDLELGQLTLDAAHERVQLVVDPSTTIFIDGRREELTALPLGVPVCAAFENGRSAVPVAQWLEPCAD